MIRRPPRSTRVRSSAASDVYKRQGLLSPPSHTPQCVTHTSSLTLSSRHRARMRFPDCMYSHGIHAHGTLWCECCILLRWDAARRRATVDHTGESRRQEGRGGCHGNPVSTPSPLPSFIVKMATSELRATPHVRLEHYRMQVGASRGTTRERSRVARSLLHHRVAREPPQHATFTSLR